MCLSVELQLQQLSVFSSTPYSIDRSNLCTTLEVLGSIDRAAALWFTTLEVVGCCS